MGLIVRLLLIVGGALAALLVAKEEPNYPVVQGVMGLVVLVLVVAGFIFLRRRR